MWCDNQDIVCVAGFQGQHLVKAETSEKSTMGHSQEEPCCDGPAKMTKKGHQGHRMSSYLSGHRHCTWWQTVKIPSQYFLRLRHWLLVDRPACPSPCRSRWHHPDGLVLCHTKTGEPHAHSQRLVHLGTLLYVPSRHRDEGPPACLSSWNG